MSNLMAGGRRSRCVALRSGSGDLGSRSAPAASVEMMPAYHLLLPAVLLIRQVIGLSIDTKLDLPDPSSSLAGTSKSHEEVSFPMDSSLSPKIVKAFYEINFVEIPKPDPHKSHITITDSKGCPYSIELCKYYFAPSKVSVVQKVEDIIQESKKDSSLTSEVPVIQGIAVSDEEKLLRELSPKISTQLKKTKAISNRNQKDPDDVPIYRGTVNVEGVLKSPEVSTLPEYRPRYPEIKRHCFQGACYRTYYK